MSYEACLSSMSNADNEFVKFVSKTVLLKELNLNSCISGILVKD